MHVALSLLAAGGLHVLAEQVVQLVLADRSGAGGPRVAFADGVFDNASLNSSRSSVGKYRTETQSVDFQKKV